MGRDKTKRKVVSKRRSDRPPVRSNKTRKSLTFRLTSSLLTFYGKKKCVVEGSDNIQWHHLDDDHSNTVFENLIPIGSTINIQLRDLKKKSQVSRGDVLSLPPNLTDESLQAQAQIHFKRWQVPAAYACSRLSVFVLREYCGVDQNTLASSACMALYYARHAGEPRLVCDVLARDILPLVRAARLTSYSRAILVQEIAGIFSEYGCHKDANELFSGIPRRELEPLDTATNQKYAGLLRRSAMAIAAEKGLTSKAEGMLKDAERIGKTTNIELSVANTRAWDRISRGCYKEALDILGPLWHKYDRQIFPLEISTRQVSENLLGGVSGPDLYRDILYDSQHIVPIDVTAWNAAELFHSAGVAAYNVAGYQKDGWKLLIRSTSLFEIKKARPFQLRDAFWTSIYSGLPLTAQGLLNRRPPLSMNPRLRHLLHTICRKLNLS